ncbi:MAG: cytidylate kinase-like family protein [Anaerolineae bacterium]|nr:cytidylate kinase-like family protein [Anaerolineae bacterium]
MGVITLSRQSGSGGDEIARLVCERLGYERFDKNTMAQLGHDLGMSAEMIDRAASLKFAPRGLLERWFGNFPNPQTDPSGWTFQARSDARQGITVAHLRDLIEAGYKKGNVVIVGRGGMAALQDKPDVLHVRIVAPQELRIKRRCEWEGCSAEEAERLVKERDITDVDWIQRYFDLDAHEPALFDLIINTRKVTFKAAAEMIVEVHKDMLAKGK